MLILYVSAGTSVDFERHIFDKLFISQLGFTGVELQSHTSDITKWIALYMYVYNDQ